MPDDDKKAAANKRRVALKKALEEHKVNPTQLAKMCGWSTPNILYNFFAGRTQSLSTQNYDQIVKALPGTTIASLRGLKAPKIIPPVVVKTQCQAGLMRETFSLPIGKIRELPLPVGDEARMAGAFAAVVRHPGAEQIYPNNSLLLIVPINRYDQDLTKGRRLVVERMLDMKIEVTVRELQQDADGRLWLSQRSTDPRYSDAVKVPEDLSGKPWRAHGEKFAIAGVVIGAFVPEG